MSSAQSFMFKILLVGDGAVGKTSIRERYMGKGFSGDYLKTIGADFASKKLQISDTKVTMQIFDLAGQDSYVVARKSFYKGGQAAFLVFDVQDPSSLTNLSTWVDDCQANSNDSIQTFIALGNKADLVDTRQVSAEMAVEYLQQLVAKTGLTFYYMDTSAKTGQNIATAFDIMAKRLLRKHNLDVTIDVPDGVFEVGPGSGNIEKEVASAVETVASASNALIGGILNESTEIITRIEKLEKNLVKVVKKVNVMEKKINRLASAVKGLMDANNVDIAVEEEEEEEESTTKVEDRKDFGVPGVPKKA